MDESLTQTIPTPEVLSDANSEQSAATGTPPAPQDNSADATLARKQLIAADRKFKKANEVLTQAEGLKQRASLVDEAEALLKSDPEAYFSRFGLTVEDILTASVSKASGKPAVLSEGERLAKLEEKLAANETAKETQLRQTVEAGVKDMLSSDESFDLINTYERHQDVATAVFEYGQKYPDMTREQAKKAVHYFARKLETQLESEHLERLSKSKKFLTKFSPREAKPEISDKNANSNGDNKTLHNGITRQGPPNTDDLPTDPTKRWEAIKARAGIR